MARAESVSERRLRPLYDALDCSRNPEAIKLANQLLKKDKSNVTAKVLKALAFVRMDRNGEADELINPILAMELDEEAVDVSALCVCLKEQGRLNDLVAVFEKLVERYPTKEDYASQLFAALVRCREHKRQQQAAMQMFKRFKSRPYYFWAVMSVVLQAAEAERKGGMGTTMATAVLLPLAEKMCAKAIEDKADADLSASDGESEHTLRLYLLVLERQKKYKQALDVIDRDSAGAFGDAPVLLLEQERQHMRLRLLAASEDWAALNNQAQKLIGADPDDWFAYLQFFNSVEQLAGGATVEDAPTDAVSEAPVPLTSFDDAVRFVDSLVQQEQDKPIQVRGPFLAQLELQVVRRPALGQEPLDDGQVVALLQGYFALFGSKPCCFADVRPYLVAAPTSVRSQFVEAVGNALPGFEKTEKEIKFLGRRVFLAQITRLSGLVSFETKSEGQDAQQMASVQALKTAFQQSLESDVQVSSSEIPPSDCFAQLAAHTLWEQFEETGNKQLLLDGIDLLERAVVRCESNAQNRLLLFRFYAAVGAIHCSLPHWGPCGIKHIQFISVGYFATDHARLLGAFDWAADLCNTTKHFHRQANGEMNEFIAQAYKFGAFHKIEEFTRFQAQLDQSLQPAVAASELCYTRLCGTSDPKQVPTILASFVDSRTDEELDSCLEDTRDLDVLDTWEPPQRGFNETDRDFLKLDRQRLLRTRVCVLRGLQSCLKKDQAALASTLDLLQQLVKGNQEALTSREQASKELKLLFPWGVVYPRGSLLSCYAPQFGAMVTGFDAANKLLVAVTKGHKGEQLAETTTAIQTLLQQLNTWAAETPRLPSTDDLMAQDIERVTVFVETLRLVAILLDAAKAWLVLEPGVQVPKPVRRAVQSLKSPLHAACKELSAAVSSVRSMLQQAIEAASKCASEKASESLEQRLSASYVTSLTAVNDAAKFISF